MNELKGYLKEFCQSWLALMCGAASLAMTAVGVFLPNKVGATCFWIAAAVCFFTASYRVWLAEHRALKIAKAAHAELVVASTPKPDAFVVARRHELKSRLDELSTPMRESFFSVLLRGVAPIPPRSKYDEMLKTYRPPSFLDQLMNKGLLIKDLASNAYTVTPDLVEDAKALYKRD